MFKLATLLLVVGFIASTEQYKFKRPFKLSCDSDSLPDFTRKIDNPCATKSKVDAVLDKFSQENAALARSMFDEFKSLSKNLFKQSFETVMTDKAEIFNELNAKDAAGYAKLGELIENADSDHTCEDAVNSMKNFRNSLNADGQNIMKKITCHVMKIVKKNFRGIMGQYFLTNMDNFAKLKSTEGQHVKDLMSLFKKSMKF